MELSRRKLTFPSSYWHHHPLGFPLRKAQRNPPSRAISPQSCPFCLSAQAYCPSLCSCPFQLVFSVGTVCYSLLIGLSVSSVTPSILTTTSWLPSAGQLKISVFTAATETSGPGYFTNVMSTLVVALSVCTHVCASVYAASLRPDYCELPASPFLLGILYQPPLLSKDKRTYFHYVFTRFVLRFLTSL